jgi:hypothetical protein
MLFCWFVDNPLEVDEKHSAWTSQCAAIANSTCREKYFSDYEYEWSGTVNPLCKYQYIAELVSYGFPATSIISTDTLGYVPEG